MIPENILNCLLSVIGLSQTTCNCFTAGIPQFATDSRSGKYITDLSDGIPVNFVGGITDCDQGGIWDILEDSRAQATRQFITDLGAEFARNYTATFSPYSGYIGRIETGTAITTAKTKGVVQIQSRKVGATMKISSIKVYSTVAGSFTINLHSEDDTTTAISTKTQTIASGWNEVVFTSPILINLQDSNRTEGTKYFLSYTIAAIGFARANQGCNSCGNYDNKFTSFVSISGHSVNSLSEMLDGTATNHGGAMMGIAINASIACGFMDFLCALDFDTYTDNSIDWIIAQTLQHGIVLNLSTRFIQSQRVNQYTIYSQDVVYGKRSHAQKEYLNGLKYIAQNLPERALQCFRCRNLRVIIQQINV